MSGFEGFRDSPQAPFYRAGARSPDDTWNEASTRLEKMIESTAAARHKPIEMTVEHVCRWHRGIFLSTFPHEAGHIRSDHEPAEFAIPIATESETVTTPMHGTGRELRQRARPLRHDPLPRSRARPADARRAGAGRTRTPRHQPLNTTNPPS